MILQNSTYSRTREKEKADGLHQQQWPLISIHRIADFCDFMHVVTCESCYAAAELKPFKTGASV